MKIARGLTDSGECLHYVERDGGACEEVAGMAAWQPRATGRKVTIRQRLAPLQPAQILGIGLNYRRHAEESKARIPEQPVLFVKGINTLQHPGQPIILPRFLASTEVDYECELAVIIGRACKNVRREEALDYVFGYTCANDVSARDWQLARGGGQWCRGKFFDTFCPLGPCLVTTDELPDPHRLAISTTLNGTKVQDWRTGDMIFDIPAIIEFLSGSTTLVPGTVILTGTPHGVGMAARPPRWLQAGDVVTISIEGIGALTNHVEEEIAGPREPAGRGGPRLQ